MNNFSRRGLSCRISKLRGGMRALCCPTFTPFVVSSWQWLVKSRPHVALHASRVHSVVFRHPPHRTQRNGIAIRLSLNLNVVSALMRCIGLSVACSKPSPRELPSRAQQCQREDDDVLNQWRQAFDGPRELSNARHEQAHRRSSKRSTAMYPVNIGHNNVTEQ